MILNLIQPIALINLVFNLKKTREDQIIEKIIENLSKDNDEYYIEHTKDSNMFMIKQDPNQLEK